MPNMTKMFPHGLLEFYLILLCAILSLGQDLQIENKICSKRGDFEVCQQLARDRKLACVENLHNVDCILNIESHVAHIGSLRGEEAFLAANLVSDDVIVVAEIVDDHPPPRTVVVVKNDVPNNINDLRGRKFCHPGFKHDEIFSHLQLLELEQAIVDIDKDRFCSINNSTLLEKHINLIADFFGNSCRPGPWTENDQLDKILKERFSSLCSLCGSAKCDVDYKLPFNDSLNCLVKNDADVSVSTLHEAEKFFNHSSNAKQKYKYLCKDGTSKSFNSPCTWSDQLNSLLVADRTRFANIRDYIQDGLLARTTSASRVLSNSDTEGYLTRILRLGRRSKVKFLSEYISLKQYVNARRPVPKLEDNEKCGVVLRWCTYSDSEYQKCTWLSQAALNRAIQPVVQCVRSTGDDEISCLDDIKRNVADIVVASSDYSFITIKKGLTPLAYPETDTRNLSTILVVKKSSDDTINHFSDLKGKRACLPRYGGKEFLAFTDKIRTIVKQENRDFAKVFNDFVGSSCTPGVRSTLIQEATEDVDKDKLCDICRSTGPTATAAYCNDDSKNMYYEDTGALQCLMDNAGDFAVITKPYDVRNYTNLRVICNNDELSPTSGLNVDVNCALIIIINSEVVSRIDNQKNVDIILALYEFEKWFGQDLHKPFELFNAFNGTLDLLFLDSTPGLTFDYQSDAYVSNYHKLLEDAKETSAPSGSSMDRAIYLIYLLVLLFFCTL